jgi:hypothetical protein
MKGWFEVKVRAKLGPEDTDDKEMTILGRTVRWKAWRIEYEADERHRKIIMEYFGLNEKSKGLTEMEMLRLVMKMTSMNIWLVEK